MIRHQGIFFPELGVYVKFKVLTIEECTEFAVQQETTPRFQYILNVLKKCIYNMNTDVMSALVNFTPTLANSLIKGLYHGCIMTNPALDCDTWVHIAFNAPATNDTAGFFSISSPAIMPDPRMMTDDDESTATGRKGAPKKTPAPATKLKPFKMTQAKFDTLERYLLERVIGQEEAVKEVCSALRLQQAGLNDTNRPIATFLFAGASGTGKTYLAQELHQYLFGDKYDMLRIDCGEFQHRHENQKLLGSPPGYIGHEEGGLLKQVATNPNTVVLIDEVEKAHPDILNTFLRIFDEGKVLDNKGTVINFSNTVIIMTSNIGNEKVAKMMHNRAPGFTANIDVEERTTTIPSRDAVERAAKESMIKFFRPEFINRIDSTVIFNFLTRDDCLKIAEQQLEISAEKVGKLGYSLIWETDVVDKVIELGFNTLSNARGMRGVRSKYIDSAIASKILGGTEIKRGDIFNLRITKDGMFDIDVSSPQELTSD